MLTRAARDFTDDDVERAALLPTLVALAALGALHRRTLRPGAPGRLAGAGGRTADALGSAVLELPSRPARRRSPSRAPGISERTVRKHLEHLYAKLGVHDRLSAVNVLRGVVPAAPPPPGVHLTPPAVHVHFMRVSYRLPHARFRPVQPSAARPRRRGAADPRRHPAPSTFDLPEMALVLTSLNIGLFAAVTVTGRATS